MSTVMHLELLREAWPLGFLPIRGVITVGGWQCLGHGGQPGTASGAWTDWIPPFGRRPPGVARCFHDVPGRGLLWQAGLLHTHVTRAVEAGRMLPDLAAFTTDQAQHGALTADLAAAALPECPGFHHSMVFAPTDAMSYRWSLWFMVGWRQENHAHRRWTSDLFEPTTGDAGLALARCRAQLRREGR